MGEVVLFNFHRTEYNRGGVDWYPRTAVRLLVLNDVLRHLLRSKVFISPDEGAVGRRLGKENKSQHNLDYWGEVRATDFFVPGVPAHNVIAAMRSVGHNGIGLYPEGLWNGEQANRYHGDVRTDRSPRNPATWGELGGKVCSLDEALDYAQRQGQ